MPSAGIAKSAKREAPLWRVLAVLIGLPLLLVLAKQPGSPAAGVLSQYVSLVSLPDDLQRTISHVLFVPLAALLVVLVRVTLGIRMLGPFRSILLAVAFQVTGIVPGSLFMIATVAMILAIRPAVRSLGMPYFGRVTVMLSAVAVLLTAGVLVGRSFEWEVLQSIVYFPIVVLSLIADAFARTVKKEGTGSALWRAAVTTLIAVGLTALSQVPLIVAATLRYPELLIAQIGGIVIVSRLMPWRIWAHLNPSSARKQPEETEDDDEPLIDLDQAPPEEADSAR